MDVFEKKGAAQTGAAQTDAAQTDAAEKSSRSSAVTEAEARHFRAFLDELERRGRAAKTIGSYRSDWIGFVDWYRATRQAPFGVEALDGPVVEAFREHLQTGGMRPATVNRKLVFLKRYAGWATKRGLLRSAAHAAAREVSAVPQGPRRPKGLSDLELRRFLTEVERRGGERDQALVYALLETGLRVSELVALQVDDLSLTLRSGVVVPTGRGVERRLPIGALGRRKLRAWLQVRGEEAGPLFTGERGPLTANAVQRVVRRFCHFAKVPVSPGTLRHTFASTYLAEHDGDLVALADLLGHESLETTRLYLAGEEQAAPGILADGMTRVRPVAVLGGLSADGDEGAPGGLIGA